MPSKYPILIPNLQVGFHYRLETVKHLYFHDALRKTIAELNVAEIDSELKRYVSEESLKKLALSSLRGEAVFPIPLLLKSNPYLLGYYRLMYGFSQKEFYTKGPFGSFKSMEESGTISKIALANLEDFCASLISAGAAIVAGIENLSVEVITELQLLTVGPQLRGSMNNEYGQTATQKTFGIIKDIVAKYIES